MARKRTAAEWLIRDLKKRGVEWIATLCGHGLDPLFAAARAEGMRLADVRNEQTAAYMADVYGRLTGRVGVCAVSSGVAVANALTGVVNAHFDGSPMLLISGAADGGRLGMGAFQDLDQAALGRPVMRWSERVDSPARILYALGQAWEAAAERRPCCGPSHLMLPMDVQRAHVAEADLARPTGRARAAGEAGAREAAEALARARKPLIVAGSGVFYAGEGTALRKFAERAAIPVVTPIWDRGVFDEESEVFLGVVGAATGGADLLNKADCIVAAGAAADYRVGYWQRRRAPVHVVERGWEGLSYDGEPKKAWLRAARRKPEAFRKSIERRGRTQARAGSHAIHVVEAIRRALPAEGVLLVDGGSIGQWAHQLLCANRYPSHWLTCGRSGVVGWGVAGAMAARLAHPARPVVLLSGDGSFTFTPAEIECAVRQRLPYVAIVADDESWGITETGHRKQFGAAISSHLGPVDFAGLARALGANGVRVEKAEAIEPELRKALAQDAVTVLHVPIVGGNPS